MSPVTDSDSATEPAPSLAGATAETRRIAVLPRIADLNAVPLPQIGAGVSDHPPLSRKQAAHSAAAAPGQMPLWTAGVWTASPLMRSLMAGIVAGVVAAAATVWLFDNILLAILAYAVFGAVGILVMALK
jgi:hypothetical protein